MSKQAHITSAPAVESLRGWHTTLTVTCPVTGKVIEARETDREFTHAVAFPPRKHARRYRVLSMHAGEQAAHKGARAHALGDGYVILPVNDPRKPAVKPLNSKPAVWGKIAPRRWGILKPAVDLTVEPAPVVEPAPARGAVTLLEQAAIKGVDMAEFAADPLNQFTLARAAVRTAATVARWVRRR